jgi:hypothetical protein
MRNASALLLSRLAPRALTCHWFKINTDRPIKRLPASIRPVRIKVAEFEGMTTMGVTTKAAYNWSYASRGAVSFFLDTPQILWKGMDHAETPSFYPD